MNKYELAMIASFLTAIYARLYTRETSGAARFFWEMLATLSFWFALIAFGVLARGPQ